MPQKIAILGGTFNPVHNGHLHLACAVHQLYHFDHVLIIPTNLPPHKQSLDLCSNQDRFHMCQLAFGTLPGFEVSDIEFRISGKSYTVHTLERLREKYLDAEFFLLMGGDMFMTFHRWYRYLDILELAKVIAVARTPGEYETLKVQQKIHKEYGGRTEVLDLPVVCVSSTQIRNDLRKGKAVTHLIPHKVLAYIKENHLFEGE